MAVWLSARKVGVDVGGVVGGGPGLAGGGGGRPKSQLLALPASRKQRQLVLSH